jgi:hypothetical protein
MDIAVKWIFQHVRLRSGPIEAGQKPSLCFKGRKHMLCVSAGHPVRVLKRDAADFDHMRQVLQGDKPYTVEDAVRRLREIAQRNGITVAAEKLLSRALLSAPDVDDEEEFNDEEDQQMFNKDGEKPEGGENTGTETEGEAKDTGTGMKDTSSTTEGNKKETAVATKGKKAKGGGKTKAKAKGKSAAPAAKKSKTAAKGDTPFRAGTMKESAFKEFKANVTAFDKLERGGKKEWCEKLAKKLGASAATIASWVNGPFRKALGK